MDTTLAFVLFLLVCVVVFYLWKHKGPGGKGNGPDPHNITTPPQLNLQVAEPVSIPRRDWVKYLTGISEPELREGDNIKGVIRPERVDKYNTHRFTFVNKYTNVEYDAGYFYTDTIGHMQKEFEMRPGDKGVFRSCKLVAELRQDYVINGTNPIHLHSQLLFLSPFLEIDQVRGRCVHAVSA